MQLLGAIGAIKIGMIMQEGKVETKVKQVRSEHKTRYNISHKKGRITVRHEKERIVTDHGKGFRHDKIVH